MKTNHPIPAKVSQDGMNAKPVNPYELTTGFNNLEYRDFESQYPERPLTQPMPPGSEIMVERDAVWQGLLWDKNSDDGNGGYEWEVIFESSADWFNRHHNTEGEIKKTRQAYQPILTNQQSEGEKEQPTEQQIGTPVNLGVANGIKPCPLCNGVEGEDVFLGYQEPRYMITCVPCSLRIIDDRKDKVQAKWNLRNGKGFWDNMPASQPTADQSASVETVEDEKDLSYLAELSTSEIYLHGVIAGKDERIKKLKYELSQYQQSKDLQQVVELIEGEIGALTVDKLEISPEDHFVYSIVINSKIDALTYLLTQIKQQNGED